MGTVRQTINSIESYLKKNRIPPNEAAAKRYSKNCRDLLAATQEKDPKLRDEVFALMAKVVSEHDSISLWSFEKPTKKYLKPIVAQFLDPEQSRIVRLAAAVMLECESELPKNGVAQLRKLLKENDRGVTAKIRKHLDREFVRKPRPALVRDEFLRDPKHVGTMILRYPYYGKKSLKKLTDLAHHEDAKVREALNTVVDKLARKGELPANFEYPEPPAGAGGKEKVKAIPKETDWAAIGKSSDEMVLNGTDLATAWAKLGKLIPANEFAPLAKMIDAKTLERDYERIRKHVLRELKRPPNKKFNVLAFSIIQLDHGFDIDVNAGAGFDPRDPESETFEGYDYCAKTSPESVVLKRCTKAAYDEVISFEVCDSAMMLFVGIVADRICSKHPEVILGGATYRYVKFGFYEGDVLIGVVTPDGYRRRNVSEPEASFVYQA